MEVSEIIESVDIVDYISQFCDLEERSDGEYWGLSPLKEENTPSFSVSPEKQRFFDFSSGKGGNVLDFICLYNSCDFYKGMKILKNYANVKDDENECVKRLNATSIAKKYNQRDKPLRNTTYEILPDDYMKRYEFNEEKLSAWLREGISKEALRRFQVMYDPFSDRVVYPIKNNDGKIINVCGRTLDPDFKLKKIRKYTYFKKFGALDVIYGLSENKQEILSKGEIILFEGAKSVMKAYGWGIKNTGALLTSHLNYSQFKVLIKLGVRIVFALDAEVDITQDANIKKLLPYAQVEWVKNRDFLLDEKDSPVDKGEEVWRNLYERRCRITG